VLLFTTPAFNLQFPSASNNFVVIFFVINQFAWPSGLGIFGAFAGVMAIKALGNIFGNTGVIGIISTSEDV